MLFIKNNRRFLAYAIVISFLIMIIPFGNLAKADISDLQSRISSRDYPSVFQAWNAAQSGPGIGSDQAANIAKHDLYWGGVESFGLQWNNGYAGLGTDFTPASISNARSYVDSLKALNPNIVVLSEIRYFVSSGSYLPADSPWWKRDGSGNRIPLWGYYVEDWNNEDLRIQVATQCGAVTDLDFMDGVLIDCFAIDLFGDADCDANRVDMIKRIRERIGDKLIVINGNMFKKPNVAQYVNGLFMETFDSATAEDWKVVSDTLRWAENNLREPVVNCLEVWPDSGRNDLYKMRAVTTLSLTHGDGYCLFADSWSHYHDWYVFWDTDLGTPVTEGWQRPDNEMFQREFTNGTVIYNPKGNGNKSITFAETRKSAATGTESTTFTVNENDGDIFTYVDTPPVIQEPTAKMITDNYPASICSQQGVSNWYTQYWNGSSYQNMTWDTANSNNYRYTGNGLTVYGVPNGTGGRMDIATTSNDIATKWVAPSDGNITVTGPAYKPSGTGDGVKLTIKKNDTVIWGPAVLSDTTAITPAVNTSVNEGDAIYCIANANGTTSGDTVYWKCEVKLYVNAEPPAASSAPPVSSSAPPVASSAPPVASSAPPVSSSAPPAASSQAPSASSNGGTDSTSSNAGGSNNPHTGDFGILLALAGFASSGIIIKTAKKRK